MVLDDSTALLTDRRPAAPYARVKAFLKEALASGRWLPGVLMPSDAELVAQFGVSRMTVTRPCASCNPKAWSNGCRGLAHSPRISTASRRR